jgi:hypothetical protein
MRPYGKKNWNNSSTCGDTLQPPMWMSLRAPCETHLLADLAHSPRRRFYFRLVRRCPAACRRRGGGLECKSHQKPRCRPTTGLWKSKLRLPCMKPSFIARGGVRRTSEPSPLATPGEQWVFVTTARNGSRRLNPIEYERGCQPTAPATKIMTVPHRVMEISNRWRIKRLNPWPRPRTRSSLASTQAAPAAGLVIA